VTLTRSHAYSTDAIRNAFPGMLSHKWSENGPITGAVGLQKYIRSSGRFTRFSVHINFGFRQLRERNVSVLFFFESCI
jgi:hypothetical protein